MHGDPVLFKTVIFEILISEKIYLLQKMHHKYRTILNKDGNMVLKKGYSVSEKDIPPK